MPGQKPLIVTIDTNVFEKANFFFNGQDLSILKKYIQDGTISGLLICDLVIEECKKHFRDRIRALNERIDKVISSREGKALSATKSFNSYIRPLDEKVSLREMNALLNQFLKDTNAVIVKTNKVKLTDIWPDYFSGLPPFANKEKKHEFPDAVMLKALKKLSASYDEIVAVSDDGDWESVLNGCNGFRFFTSLQDLYSSITKEKMLSAKAQEYYYAHCAEINNAIEDELYLLPFDVDGFTYGRKGIEDGYDYTDTQIQNINIKSRTAYIDYVNDEEVVAKLFVQATFEIECEFFDEENSVWDSDIHDYMIRETGLLVEEHTVDFYVLITYKVKDGEIEKYVEIKPLINNDKLLFNSETLIERYSRNTDGFFSYKQTYVCPKCGHKIKIDLIDYADTSVIATDRGMGSEIQHEIECEGECPNCGNEYKISGSVYEYPAGAFNYDNTKIDWKK